MMVKKGEQDGKKGRTVRPYIIMKKLLLTLLLITLGISQNFGQTKDPFNFSAPKDWRSERIPFPLDFAPKLNYKGFEELRFAPGMFDPKSDTYFTYTFFWWLDGEPIITPEQLERDLVNYFQGLTSAVGKSKGKEYDLSKVRAKVTPLAESETKLPYKTKYYQAVVDTYDPFASQNLLTLNMEISLWDCDVSKNRVAFFSVSPKAKDQAVWKAMQDIRDSFRCAK
jgi:hypothetical protein